MVCIFVRIGLHSLISANKSRPDYKTGGSTHDRYWTEMRANRHAANYFEKYYGVDWSIYEEHWNSYGYYPRK